MIQYDVRRQGAETFLAVTGCAGQLRDALVAEHVNGLPVRVVASRAFAGNKRLRTVSLPESVHMLEGFVFHNCSALSHISMTGAITEVGEGIIRQCTSLSQVSLTHAEQAFWLISRLLAESDNTLTFLLQLPEGEARLTFPGFVYDFTENTMARTIQFNIAGSGMAFRECVSRSGIDFAAYDRLFNRAKLDDITTITTLICNRLRFPYALTTQAKEQYEAYLAAHGGAVLRSLLSDENRECLQFLTGTDCGVPWTKADLQEAIAISSEKQLTAITAMLMNCSRMGSGRGKQGVIQL